MEADSKWSLLGWKHPLWELVRYYLSVSNMSRTNAEKWLMDLKNNQLQIDGSYIRISDEALANQLVGYLKSRESMFEQALKNLRDEEAANLYCKQLGYEVGVTTTENKSHHQSTKSMISAVSSIAIDVCKQKGITYNDNPQNRCVWFKNNMLHVTARNLDGAIPSLANPSIVWEIKEYWGKTKGGSKMSDAVYECHLVGKEIREYEQVSGCKISHLVFLDGKEQWGYRKSDLKRFLDLLNQGLIDQLIIGIEVESAWREYLINNL